MCICIYSIATGQRFGLSLHLHHYFLRRENIGSGETMKMRIKMYIDRNTRKPVFAHPRSLISAFVIHFLKSIICKLALDEVSIF